MMFSTLKWVKSWYGRKRRSQKKALGIVAVKTKVDHSVSTSSSGAVGVSEIQLLPQLPARPVERVDENVPVTATAKKISDSRHKMIATAGKRPLAPSRRYEPYSNAKMVTPSITQTSSDDSRPHPSESAQHRSPDPSWYPKSNSNNSTALPPQTSVTENINDTSRMNQHIGQDRSALHKWTENPSNFSKLVAQDDNNVAPSVINPYLAFNGNGTTSSSTITDISKPVHIEDQRDGFPKTIPVQKLPPSYSSMNSDLAIKTDVPMATDDSAFVSFTHLRDEGSQLQQSPATEVVDMFPRHLLDTTSSIDVDHHSSQSPAPFAHRRQDDPQLWSLSPRNVESALTTSTPSSAEIVIPPFDAHSTVVAYQFQPESRTNQLAFHDTETDTSSTIVDFPVPPARLLAPATANYSSSISEISSYASLSPYSTPQFQTTTSFARSSSPPPIYQEQSSILTPTRTSTSSLANIAIAHPNTKTSKSDLISLTLRSLANEDDTFNAAVMLVILSRAGFVWDY